MNKNKREIFIQELCKLGNVEKEYFYVRYSENIEKFSYNIQNEYMKNPYASYAVQYVVPLELCVIWDLSKHKNGMPYCLSLNVNTVEFQPNSYDCKPGVIYKKIKSSFSGKYESYEKVVYLGRKYFKNFFPEIDLYMQMNSDDACPYFKDVIAKEEHWNSPQKRKRYSVTQLSRQSDFREKVLKAYDGKCAICRCSIPDVLQAAHEKGWEVARTLYDYPNHGICLCANHHLMYDNNLIDIDLNNLTIQIVPQYIDIIKNMPWYKDFWEKYHGKIAERVDK